MKLVFDAPETRTLTIEGRDARFPVNRIFCVGRNYAAHAREMGKDPDRDLPFFFMKPPQAIVDAAAPVSIAYPPETSNYHHEIELVVAIGTGGHNIAEAAALDHVFGYGVGLDMTRRDLQLQAREQGRPWEFGKAFSSSAPISSLRPAQSVAHPEQGAISLQVNGETRQESDVNMLIWSVAESIAYLSRFETLEPGDLIMTGTPAGVGPVVTGDVMEGQIDDIGSIKVTVT